MRDFWRTSGRGLPAPDPEFRYSTDAPRVGGSVVGGASVSLAINLPRDIARYQLD